MTEINSHIDLLEQLKMTNNQRKKEEIRKIIKENHPNLDNPSETKPVDPPAEKADPSDFPF